MGEPSRVRVTGPLEPFSAGLIVELQEAGCRPASAAMQVRVLAHLSRWMQDRDVSPGVRGELERFGRERLADLLAMSGAGTSVVLDYLRRLGIVPAPVGVHRIRVMLGAPRQLSTTPAICDIGGATGSG